MVGITIMWANRFIIFIVFSNQKIYAICLWTLYYCLLFLTTIFLFKTTKKLKQWRLQLSSLFKENTKKNRLINMMKFPAELRKSDGILIKRVAVAWKEIPEKIFMHQPKPALEYKKRRTFKCKWRKSRVFKQTVFIID